MNKNEVFNHFSTLLDDMIEGSLFFQTYFQAPCYIEDVHGSIDDVNVPKNVHLYFGATRGCIVDDDFNYVVKFDIDEDSWNDSVCHREADIYSRAVRSGVARYLASCVYLGTFTKTIQFYHYDDIDQHMDWRDYNFTEFNDEFMKHEDDFGNIVSITINVPLYAYPKADYFSMDTSGASAETYNCARRINSPLRERNLSLAIVFIEQYGEEAYVDFTEFMVEENINDLHCGNVGMVNGSFVLIDYAGYHSSDERDYY